MAVQNEAGRFIFGKAVGCVLQMRDLSQVATVIHTELQVNLLWERVFSLMGNAFLGVTCCYRTASSLR